MTRTQAQIIELFRTLGSDEQKELVEQLFEQTYHGTFYGRMSPEQRAELDRSIAEADRGEGTEASIVMARLSRKFGFSRSA